MNSMLHFEFKFSRNIFSITVLILVKIKGALSISEPRILQALKEFTAFIVMLEIRSECCLIVTQEGLTISLMA